MALKSETCYQLKRAFLDLVLKKVVLSDVKTHLVRGDSKGLPFGITNTEANAVLDMMLSKDLVVNDEVVYDAGDLMNLLLELPVVV